MSKFKLIFANVGILPTFVFQLQLHDVTIPGWYLSDKITRIKLTYNVKVTNNKNIYNWFY